MVIAPEQQAFLQSLIQSGVQLSVTHWAIGEILIAPDKIQAFVQDEDQFAADYHKVSKEQLLAWGCFINNQLCLGTTKLGKQCANRADAPESVLSPHQFDRSNLNCYCHLHKPFCVIAMPQIFETDESLLQSLAQETEFGVSMLQRRAFWGYNRAARKIEEWINEGKIRQVESVPFRFVVCAHPRPGLSVDCQMDSKTTQQSGGEALP